MSHCRSVRSGKAWRRQFSFVPSCRRDGRVIKSQKNPVAGHVPTSFRRKKMLKTLLMSSALLLSATTIACNRAAASAIAIPDPAVDETLRNTSAKQTIVLAGGCFWGVDAVFKHVKGVTDVKSGFAGGKGAVSYEEVSTGNTGYAESVQITYDPSKITYGKLLKVFFAVAHDPTEVNRQGPDTGTQYRSAIFYATDEQKRIA